jgi:heme-degrading monooxygenase HmoA
MQQAYFAVVFTSKRTPVDSEGYEEMSQRMVELAAVQPGYLGIESARGSDGVGITVSYWESLEAIRAWKAQAEHQAGPGAWAERLVHLVSHKNLPC